MPTHFLPLHLESLTFSINSQAHRQVGIDLLQIGSINLHIDSPNAKKQFYINKINQDINTQQGSSGRSGPLNLINFRLERHYLNILHLNVTQKTRLETTLHH